MVEKDIISKKIIKHLIEDFNTYLFHLQFDRVEILETQYQRVEERRADIVAKITDKNKGYLLHVEIQNNNEPLMHYRMLRYRCDIAMQWPKEPIKQFLTYIGKEKLTMHQKIQSQELNYQIKIIDMHDIDCQQLLENNSPDALILAILCDFKGRNERDVIHEIIIKLKDYYKENVKGFRESLAMLETLSSNRNLSVDIQKEEKMLSMYIDELPSYKIGYEKGVENGKPKWMKEGKTEGKIEGKIEIAINMLSSFDDQKIALYTGLEISEVLKIRQEHQ